MADIVDCIKAQIDACLELNSTVIRPLVVAIVEAAGMGHALRINGGTNFMHACMHYISACIFLVLSCQGVEYLGTCQVS
jgi:hypothetical protein